MSVSTPFASTPPQAPATCSPTEEPVKIEGPSNVRSVYALTRENAITEVERKYNEVVLEYIAEYRKWMSQSPNAAGPKPRAVQELNTELIKLRNEVEKDNDQVSNRLQAMMNNNASGGTCSGGAGCNKDSEQLCNNAPGCTWQPAKQQTLYERATNIAQQGTELADRQGSFASSQQRTEHMQSKYRYARKIFWIYAAVALLLVGGFAYLYIAAYKTFASTGASLGAAMTGAVSSGIESASNRMSDMGGEEGEEGEEGEMDLSEEMGEEEE